MLDLILAAVDPALPASEVTQMDVYVLSLLGGLIIPLITAVVTKKVASPGLKSLCTTLLSVVAGAVAVATQADGQVVLGQWLNGIFTSFIAAIATYYGFWKPTSIAPKLQDRTYNFGLGTAGGGESVQSSVHEVPTSTDTPDGTPTGTHYSDDDPNEDKSTDLP